MSADDDPVTVLSEDESWSLLSSMSFGRLVTSLGGQPEIFPVNFVTQRPTVLFRTAEGTKLFSAVMNNQVAFEADDHTVAEGWSVIVKGTAHVLLTSAEIEEGRASAAAAVDRDVEASLRAGDRLGNHRPAVQVRSRTGSRIHLRLMTARRHKRRCTRGGRGNRDCRRPLASGRGGVADWPRHQFATLQRGAVSLDDVKKVCRAFDVTFNDVSLAAITDSFRTVVLGRRCEQPRRNSLRTLVPVSVRSANAFNRTDNRVSVMLPFRASSAGASSRRSAPPPRTARPSRRRAQQPRDCDVWLRQVKDA